MVPTLIQRLPYTTFDVVVFISMPGLSLCLALELFPELLGDGVGSGIPILGAIGEERAELAYRHRPAPRTRGGSGTATRPPRGERPGV